MLLTSLLLLCPGGLVQEPPQVAEASFSSLDNGLRHKQVYLPGSRHECLAVVFRVGHVHDPIGQTGLAEVVGETLRLLQEEVAESQRFRIDVRGAFTLMWTTVPIGELDRPAGFLDELMAGRLVVADDLLARAIAKAVLRADNESMVFPGPILRQRAQRLLLEGTPQGRQFMGIPSEMKTMKPDLVRERLASAYRPRHAILTALGGATEADLSPAFEELAALPPGELGSIEPMSHDPLPRPGPAVTNPHVDAPFVSAALRAPSRTSPDFLPFLIATEWLRTRAEMAFRDFRGGESLARFPFVDYRYMEGDPIALLNRRGLNGSSLEDVKAELARFLLTQCESGVTQRTVGSAVRAIALEMSLPPYEPRLLEPMVRQKELLLPRARALGLFELWDWPTDVRARLEEVPIEAIDAALRSYFSPENLIWLALVPTGN